MRYSNGMSTITPNSLPLLTVNPSTSAYFLVNCVCNTNSASFKILF